MPAINRRQFIGSTAGAGAVTLLGKSDPAVSAEPEPGTAAARPYLAGPNAAQQARDVGSLLLYTTADLGIPSVFVTTV